MASSASFQVLNGKIMGGPVIPVESMKLLWKNDNITSPFAAQSIELLDDNYDFEVVFFRGHTTDDTELAEVIEKGKNSILTYASTNGSGVFCGRRKVTYVSDTSLSIAEASYCIGTDAPIVNNDFIIPVKVYGFKKSSIGGGDDHLMKYSTNEQIVGTWIDGKPIYQKTITGTTNSSSDPLYLATGIISIDKVINIEAAVCQAGDTYVFNNFWTNAVSSNTVLGFKVAATKNSHPTIPNNLIITASHSNYQGCPFYITIQYTKTTD